MGYVFIDELYPLIVQINPVVATTEAVEKSFADSDEIYKRGGKIAWISYLPAGVKLNTDANRLAGKLIKEREARIKAQAVGIGFLSDTRMFSFLMSTLLMVQPMPMPYKASASAAELLSWLDTLMKKASLTLAPNALARVTALIAENKEKAA